MPFMRALVSRSELPRIAVALGFAGAAEMRDLVRRAGPLAHELHRLAPAAANDGPNVEYPWPHESPTHSPATHRFTLWATLRDHALGALADLLGGLEAVASAPPDSGRAEVAPVLSEILGRHVLHELDELALERASVGQGRGEVARILDVADPVAPTMQDQGGNAHGTAQGADVDVEGHFLERDRLAGTRRLPDQSLRPA